MENLTQEFNAQFNNSTLVSNAYLKDIDIIKDTEEELIELERLRTRIQNDIEYYKQNYTAEYERYKNEYESGNTISTVSGLAAAAGTLITGPVGIGLTIAGMIGSFFGGDSKEEAKAKVVALQKKTQTDIEKMLELQSIVESRIRRIELELLLKNPFTYLVTAIIYLGAQKWRRYKDTMK
jgi:hypothetical protein